MSEYDDDQGTDIPALREAAKRGETAARERDQAMRKLALVEAGVDTRSPVGKLFTEAYKGALTEDAIKEAWAELAPAASVLPPETSGKELEPTAPEPTPEALEETSSRRTLTSAGAGDTPNETPPPDPVAAGYEEFQARMHKGEGRDVAAGSVFAHLIEGANRGDERALWDGWRKEDMTR
jgi:hypothetical protein